MTAADAKLWVVGHLLFKLNHVGAATECINDADVFSVTKAGRSWEVEIKVDRQDLRREVAGMLRALGLEPKRQGCKVVKHSRYLDPSWMNWNSAYSPVPNLFYVAVVPDLVEEATHTIPEPYGVMEVREQWVEVVRRAKPLHRDSVHDRTVQRIMRRASLEHYFHRGGGFVNGSLVTADRQQEVFQEWRERERASMI